MPPEQLCRIPSCEHNDKSIACILEHALCIGWNRNSYFSVQPHSQIMCRLHVNNTMANKSAASSLMLLLQLIQNKDWQKLHSIYFNHPDKYRSLAALINESSSFNGMTLLHAVCRFNPPSSVVKKMITLCPDDAKALDCLQRTPLHVATGTGASVNVVNALLEANPSACRAQDADGRTPLHMACDRNCVLFEGSINSNDAPRYDIVNSLLTQSPSSVTIEDGDEMTAIEYALLSSGDLKVVKMLQRASQKVLRKKHADEKMKKHKQQQQLAGFAPKDKVFSARSA